MTKLTELVELPREITSHLHPEFFKEEGKHLNTDALQRAFGEGANYMLSKITKLLDREFEVDKLINVIDNESFDLTGQGNCLGRRNSEQLAKKILLNLKSCLKGK